MPSFGKWQQATFDHDCDGCKKCIPVGQKYLRLATISKADYERVAQKPLLGLAFVQPTDGPVQRRLWDFVAHNRIPITKYHEDCWKGSATKTERNIDAEASSPR